MPRRHRLRLTGISHHVIQRGNDRLTIFRAEEDYEVFAALLGEACRRFATEIHAYVFMRTHIHLLVTPRVPRGIEKAMQVATGRYARHFNARYSRTGALFEGRYRLLIVDEAPYWFSCMRYIELNPVRAAIVSRPDAYYWSSHSANAHGGPDSLVTPHDRYLQLGSTPRERQRTWQSICAEGVGLEELQRLRAAVHQGGAFGRVVLDEDDATAAEM